MIFDNKLSIFSPVPLSALSKKECKIKAIIFFIFCQIPSPLFLWFAIIGAPLYIDGIYLGFFLFTLGFNFPIAFYHELKSCGKNKFFNEGFNLFCVLCTAPGIILMASCITWLMTDFNIFAVIISVLPFTVTPLLMCSRWKFFNDKNILIETDHHKEIVVGYNVNYYFIVMLLIGLLGYYQNFSNLNKGYLFPILWILIVFLFQIILLFPDKVNNLVSWELRRGKYCAVFLISYLVIFIIFNITFQAILLGGGNVNLTLGLLKGSISNIIFFVFAYFFFRNYNKKS